MTLEEQLDDLVGEIYFETIGCPESSNPDYLKLKIKYWVAEAMRRLVSDARNAVNDPFNAWDKGKKGPDNSDIVDRILSMMRLQILEHIVPVENFYEDAAAQADKKLEQMATQRVKQAQEMGP